MIFDEAADKNTYLDFFSINLAILTFLKNNVM